MKTFETEDSGQREEFDSGMKRDIQTGKARVDLIPKDIRNVFNVLLTRDLIYCDIASILELFTQVVELGQGSNIMILLERVIMYEIHKLTITGRNQFNATAEVYLRLAGLYGRGAVKYGGDNWKKARGDAELDRFKQSAHRHWLQCLTGLTDEDHLSAVLFNLYGIKYILDNREVQTSEKIH